MSTKNNPGEFDCYANAELDEPMFVLLARDRDASIIVKMWAFFRMQQIDMGLKPESDRAQVSEALRCATEMEIWHREHKQREELKGMEFDKEGYPLTGEHRRKVKNTTSGANDE